MKIGIYSYFGYPLSFAERLDLIKAAGFRVTAIGLGMEEDLVRAGKADLMADLAQERGMEVEYVHAPEERCNDLWSESEAGRREAGRIYSSGISYCKKHGIGMLVVHVSRSKGEQPKGQNRQGLVVIRDLAKYAEDSGVRIAMENTRKEGFVEYVLEKIDSPHLGLCYDSSHDFLYNAEPGRLLKRWGARLLATHIGDNDGQHDRHWLPWEGGIEWGVVRESFPMGRYEGCLNLEVFPKDVKAESAADFLARAYGSIEELKGFLTGESLRPR
jgi:sugar phosphate isomerase/epimerase